MVKTFDLKRTSSGFSRSIFGYLTAMIHQLPTSRARLCGDQVMTNNAACYINFIKRSI